jgi:hypothetical protein
MPSRSGVLEVSLTTSVQERHDLAENRFQRRVDAVCRRTWLTCRDRDTGIAWSGNDWNSSGPNDHRHNYRILLLRDGSE